MKKDRSRGKPVVHFYSFFDNVLLYICIKRSSFLIQPISLRKTAAEKQTLQKERGLHYTHRDRYVCKSRKRKRERGASGAPPPEKIKDSFRCINTRFVISESACTQTRATLFLSPAALISCSRDSRCRGSEFPLSSISSFLFMHV